MNKYFKMILLFVIPAFINAHTLLLNQLDNEDGTMTIVGAFSTGESASGALIKIETIKSKKILLKKRLDDNSELIVKIPKVSYIVILDGGKGHSISQKGIAPKEGFIEETTAKVTMKDNIPLVNNNTLIILIYISIFLFFATIFIGIYNTNKLVKEFRKIKK